MEIVLEQPVFAPILHIMRLPVATPKQVQVQFLLCKSALLEQDGGLFQRISLTF
jgi:hypothetical protein